jgi:hypothetical protein
MFLDLIWFKILCWKYTLRGPKSNRKPWKPILNCCDLSMDQKFYAELKKGKFMESEIQISRGTYLSIKNFIFSVKKYTLRHRKKSVLVSSSRKKPEIVSNTNKYRKKCDVTDHWSRSLINDHGHWSRSLITDHVHWSEFLCVYLWLFGLDFAINIIYHIYECMLK